MVLAGVRRFGDLVTCLRVVLHEKSNNSKACTEKKLYSDFLPVIHYVMHTSSQKTDINISPSSEALE